MDDFNLAVLALLNEELEPLGFGLERAAGLFPNLHMDVRSYSTGFLRNIPSRGAIVADRDRLALFEGYNGFEGEWFLIAHWYWTGRWKREPLGYCLDLADPLFPEKAGEWVRSVLSQS